MQVGTENPALGVPSAITPWRVYGEETHGWTYFTELIEDLQCVQQQWMYVRKPSTRKGFGSNLGYQSRSSILPRWEVRTSVQ